MERVAAEDLLRKQKADGVQFHSLPFLVRKGNKGLTLTSARPNIDDAVRFTQTVRIASIL